MNKLIPYFVILFSLPLSAEVVVFNAKNTTILKYSKTKAHKVSFDEGKLTLSVDGSSGPVVRPFKSPKNIKKIRIEAKVAGALKLTGEQGSKGNDDFRLRVGLVYEGARTLNFFQKKASPKWIKVLFNLAKAKSKGIDGVYFYNTYTDKALKNKKRKHPLSSLLREDFSLVISESGVVSQEIAIESDKKVLGLWISSDGDDTKSKFKIDINKIEVL